MIRKKKNYSRPKRPFEKIRIVEEEKIKKEYGLKNKKEIWKAEAKIKSMREKAKKMISKDHEEQKKLFDQLKKIGIDANSIGDVLALDKKDYLEQRLQTILVKKKMATTMKQARQLITHKKIMVDGKIINIPSYIVPVELREKITVKEKIKKKTKEVHGEKNEDAEKSERNPEEKIKEEENENA
jgi:small subunit ribosomal protein S4